MASRVKFAPWLLLQLAVRRVEGLTLLALMVCLAAAGLHELLRPSLERQVIKLEQSLKAPPADRRLDEATALVQRYRGFEDRLAERSERGELLKTVFAEAATAGLPLAQGDYSWVSEADGGYDKLQIVLPVKGTYQQVRAFAETLLAKLPSLALDEISFRRETVKSTGIEARLRLTLYLKNAH